MLATDPGPVSHGTAERVGVALRRCDRLTINLREACCHSTGAEGAPMNAGRTTPGEPIR